MTPELQLHTLFILDDRGRIVANREPGPSQPAAFYLIRSPAQVAFAVRADLPTAIADELAVLARSEPPAELDPPIHADRYLALLGGEVDSGPAFTFPPSLPSASVVELHDESLLHRHLRGWVPGEIAEGRAPALAILDDGHAVSVCFCARRSTEAAEAGLDTAASHRGRGLAGQVTAAWATAIRAMGLIPLYSTSWTNTASLAVARKLGLLPYATDWKILVS